MEKKTVWCAFGTRKDDGIIAAIDKGVGIFPLVCMEENNLSIMKEVAKKVATATGCEIVFGKFELTEIVETFGSSDAS